MVALRKSSTASRALQGTALSTLSVKSNGFERMAGALAIALLLAGQHPALAQNASNAPAVMTLDPSQQGAGVAQRDMAANGTPVVKIATPNGSGVSHNRYTDFNVDQRGLILNNSGQIVATQLAGWIDGNGNLRDSGAARIILNEVTGPRASALNGYVEVAGAAAQVVVANPYGITCSGCGFLNAPNVALVAGRPNLNPQGQLTGYTITDGALSVAGQGLDASGARLSLFANAIAVNAVIWAEAIEAGYGAGTIDTATGDIVVNGAPRTDTAPRVALDVAALGGMYARSIRLVGTQAGLGVNVSGTLASLEQGLTLSADGRVTIGGRVNSAGDLTIATRDQLDVAGSVYAAGNAQVAAGSVNAAGLLAAAGNVGVEANSVSGTGTIAAGLQRDGTLGTTGNLTLFNSGTLALSSNAVAAGDAVIRAANIQVDGSLQGQTLRLQAAERLGVGTEGQLRGAATVDLTAASVAQSGLVTAKSIQATASRLDNSGVIGASESLTLNSDVLNGNGGTLQSGGALAIAAGAIDLTDSAILGLGTNAVTISASRDLTLTQSEMATNGDLSLAAANVTQSGADSRIASVQNLNLSVTGQLSAQGGVIAAGRDLTATAAVTNITNADMRSTNALALISPELTVGAGGRLLGGSLTLGGQNLSNAGTIAGLNATGSVQLRQTASVDNRGTIQSNGADFNINTNALTNGGEILHSGANPLTITATSITNSGRIAANSGVTVSASTLTNSGTLASAGAVALNAQGLLRNVGAIASAQGVTLRAEQFEGNSGSVEAGNALTIDANTITLGNGKYIAAGAADLNLTAQNGLTATGAIIGGNGNVQLSGSAVDLGGSEVTALGTISLRANAGDLRLGQDAHLASAKSLNLSATGTVDASNALLEGTDAAIISGTSILLDNAIVQSGLFDFDTSSLSLRNARLRHTGTNDFTLTSTGTLDYSGGEIYSAGTNFTLSAANLINQGGHVLHAGSGLLDISASGAIDNSAGGQIATNGKLSLRAASFNNATGTVSSVGDATFRIDGATNNDGGVIASSAALTLGSAGLANRGGTIESVGNATLAAASLAGAGGNITATGATSIAQLDVAGAVDGLGQLGSNGSVNLTSASLRLGTGDRIVAGQDITVATRNGDMDLVNAGVSARNIALLANGGSLITGDTSLIIAAEQLRLSGADMRLGAGALQGRSVAIQGGNLALAGGLINALDTLDLSLTGGLSNVGGEIYAASALKLNALSLSNANGTIASTAGGVNLTVINLLDNSHGLIVAETALNVRSNSFANTDGRISGGTATLIASTGLLDNALGLIRSDGDITLSAASIGNAAGTIDALGGIRMTASSLQNGDGQIIARGNQGLVLGGANSGLIDITNSAGGLIGSGVAMDIRAGTLANAGSLQARTATVSANTLINAGVITTNDVLTLTSASLDNRGGKISGGTSLSLSGTTLDNSNGGSIAAGAGGLTAQLSGNVTNTGGSIGGDGDVTLRFATLVNDGGTLAAGRDLALTGQALTQNAQGVIWADQDARITLAGQLTSRGSIGADRDLIINSATIDNGLGDASGILYATRNLKLTFDSGALGRTIAGTNLELNLSRDYTNAAGQTLSSQGGITFNISGNFTNLGIIESNLGVMVDATGNILNGAGATLSAPEVWLNADGDVTNLGLINGGAYTDIRASNVFNQGRIYGDAVTIAAGSSITNNGADAVIATRSGWLTLQTAGSAQNLDGALLYALGNLAITGLNGSGSAASLLNSSATIEAQQNIIVSAASIINQRTRFAWEDQSQTTTTDTGWRNFNGDENYPRRNEWDDYRIRTSLTDTNTVITDQTPEARIVSGGSMSIRSDALSNSFSTISAGGDLFINDGPVPQGTGDTWTSGIVINSGLTGRHTTFLRKTSDYRDTGIFDNGHDTIVKDTTTSENTFTVQAIITAGGTLGINARSIDNVNVVQASGVSGVTASVVTTASGGLGDGANVSAGSATNVTGGTASFVGGATGVSTLNIDPASIRVDAVNVATLTSANIGLTLTPVQGEGITGTPVFSLNLNGLFNFADPSRNYLVESDPAFVGYNSFLSSDYFLARLGFDPAQVQRRLGDALYEQQLISKQLVAQAGSARLRGYGDNEAQYRALMDAGVLVAQQFQLAPGVGLSAEQMATLSSSIVLLVEVEVQGPNGAPVKVLAPRVYLAKVDQRDLTGGAVIAGNDIRLRTADGLTNSGVIRATRSTVIEAGSVNNLGRIDFGETGFAQTRGDLVSSGVITGGDLSLRVGGDLRLEPRTTTSTVATSWRSGKNFEDRTTTTVLNRAGSLAVTGNLAINTDGTFSVVGSTIDVGGNLNVAAFGGIDIRAAQDTLVGTHSGRNGKTRYSGSDASTTNILSSIQVGGDALLTTPGAFSVTGGAIAADGALAVSAGSIAIAGVVDESRFVRDNDRRSSGFLSSSRTTTHSEGVDQLVVGSLLSGDTVSLRSMGDTSILGSSVVASNGLAINAGGDLTIGTIVENDSSNEWSRTRRSGLSIGGGGLFIGSAKSRNESDLASTNHVGSLIGSEAGNVTLRSGDALNIVGSSIAGTEQVTLIGQSINVAGALNAQDTREASRSSSVGLTIGANSPVLNAVDATVRMARLATTTTDSRAQAVAGLAGGLAVYNGVDSALDMARTIGAGTGDLGVSVSATLGFSKSRSESESHTESVLGSSITGGDVTLVATGAGRDSTITVAGSEIRVDRDITLAADGAISLISQQERDTSSSSYRSSGASIGVSWGLSLSKPEGAILSSLSFTPTITAGYNSARGSSAGEDIRHIESILDAGGTLRIATPEELLMRGALASGNRVDIAAGALTIESEQDSSTFTSRDKSMGVSVSYQIGGTLSGALNVGRGRQDGDFASVIEQSGIYAGTGGFDIRVDGQTRLTGAVIASEADAAHNRLVTGTLVASDLENRENYSASQMSLGVGLGGISLGSGGKADTRPNSGSPLPGISTPLGNLTATPPVAMGARGSQDDLTHSAIAPGVIEITSGDSASLTLAQTISRDTAGANLGSITQEFDAARRLEISQGFDAARELSTQTSTFLTNRAADSKRWTEEHPGVDPSTNPYAIWGAGGAGNIVLTALNGAASGNVAGSTTQLVRAAAVNVLQSLATTQVKHLVDGMGAGDAATETARAALQGLVGCAGAAAGGSGSCSSAAMGASASAVLNYLLNEAGAPHATDQNGNGIIDPEERSSLEDQQARTNLVTTIVGAIASSAGLDTANAVTAAQIETQNNQLIDGSIACQPGQAKCPTWPEYFATERGQMFLAIYGNQATIEMCAQPGSSTEQCQNAVNRYVISTAKFLSQSLGLGSQLIYEYFYTPQELYALEQQETARAMAFFPQLVARAELEYRSGGGCLDSGGLCYPLDRNLSPEAAIQSLFWKYKDQQASNFAADMRIAASLTGSTVSALGGDRNQALAGVQLGEIGLNFGIAGQIQRGSLGQGAFPNARITNAIELEAYLRNTRNADTAAESSILNRANFAQRTFASTFSTEGRFSGRSVASVASDLAAGRLSPSDLPIEYIVRDGNTLILNTRSAQALQQANIPRSQWRAVNMTGDSAAEARLTGQLRRNRLTTEGTPTTRPSRGR